MRLAVSRQYLVTSVLAISLALSISYYLPTTVLAQTTATKSAAADQRLTNLKTKADREIQRRLTTLNNLLNKITAFTKITADDTSALSSLIQTDITSLTSLQTKIATDTTLAALRADVQSITKDYRVYLLIRPKAGLVVAADAAGSFADKLTKLSAQLQTKINEAQSQGKDVTALQATMTDMQAKIADANTQIKKIHDTVMPLTPEGYPANKSTLQSAVTLLHTVRSDLQTAKTDARTIVQGLKGQPVSQPTATSSTTSANPIQ